MWGEFLVGIWCYGAKAVFLQGESMNPTMMQLPEDFRTQMLHQLGTSEAEALFASLDAEPPVSIRVNARKGQGGEGDPVPWCATGRYLPRRPQFTLDPLLHAGCYYVQEASSMAVEQAYRVLKRRMEETGEAPRRVLDLCAAPGGKSTLWASLLEDALLVCNEPVRERAQILTENMTKWGAPDVVVTNAYPKDFSPLVNFFDVIAADVPCSGEGMFRKDEGARSEWSADNVKACAERQRSIVADVWPALRPGGFLVYSTCTFNRQENEDNVRYICSELGATPIDLSESLGMEGSAWGTHFFPHRARGEGFFLALLQKDAAALPAFHRKKQKQAKGVPQVPSDAVSLLKWLDAPQDYTLYMSDDECLYALRQPVVDGVRQILATPLRTHVWKTGVMLARRKGNKWQPAAALALSTVLDPEAFPRAELSLAEALDYLRREAIVLPADTPRGYVLVCYDGHPLGFVNNLGTRANNLYPTEWRIRRL